ncbi:MAG: tetratricopeptide repeat protein [Pseudomonadota bacterium]
MVRAFFCLLILGLASSPVIAKPLITSSEDTMARICLARSETPPRIVSACDAALTAAGLTQKQRAEFITARGDGYLWLDQYSVAVASFEEALALDKTATDAWNGLGWALWELEGDVAAYGAFDTSLSIGVSVQALGGKAATGRRMGKLSSDEARVLLTAALSIDPDYIWAVREIAWSYLDEGDAQRATAEFEAALDIEPADINARYGLGRAKLSENKAEEALVLFNQVLIDAPDDFPSLVYRIIALRELDRNSQALREADRLIAAYPEKSSGYIERGQALLALGRRAEAIETYELADTRLGANNAILYWYADALSTDGRFAEALAVIDRAIVLSGADYSDHLLRSYIALELRDYATARAAAEASLATGVKDPWAHFYLAITLVRAGEVAAGLLRFEQALESGLPIDRVGAFASELVGVGNYVEAAELRLKY